MEKEPPDYLIINALLKLLSKVLLKTILLYLNLTTLLLWLSI